MMWKSPLSLKGSIILVCTFTMILVQDASCRTHNDNEPSKLSYVNNNLKNQPAANGNELLKNTANWRDSRSQYDNGNEATAVVQSWPSPSLPQSAASAVERYAIDDDGPSVETAGFEVPPLLSAVGSAAAAAGPFGPYQQLPQLFAGVSGGQLLLQRLLFGHMLTVLQHPIDGYLSFCNRMAAVGRFLNRLFEPLFTAGFYTAASYVFRRSILPRIAHYIHMYTAMNGGHHVHDTEARSDDGNGSGASLFGDLNAVLTAAASVTVNGDAIDDPPACLRKMICEAGLAASNNSITRPFRRMAKIIISKNELANIFKESFTGSLSECSQYTCNNQEKL